MACATFWNHPILAMSMCVHMHAIPQHCPKVSGARSSYMSHVSVLSHGTYSHISRFLVPLISRLFTCKQCPSTIPMKHWHTCSYMCHVPSAPSHGDMGIRVHICAVFHCQAHACLHVYYIPTQSHGSKVMQVHIQAMSQHHRMVAWLWVLTYELWLSTVTWSCEHTCSHTSHVPALLCDGMSTQVHI